MGLHERSVMLQRTSIPAVLQLGRCWQVTHAAAQQLPYTPGCLHVLVNKQAQGMPEPTPTPHRDPAVQQPAPNSLPKRGDFQLALHGSPAPIHRHFGQPGLADGSDASGETGGDGDMEEGAAGEDRAVQRNAACAAERVADGHGGTLGVGQGSSRAEAAREAAKLPTSERKAFWEGLQHGSTAHRWAAESLCLGTGTDSWQGWWVRDSGLHVAGLQLGMASSSESSIDCRARLVIHCSACRE